MNAPLQSSIAIADRVAALEWSALREQLDAQGFATTGPLLETHECRGLAANYVDGGYRSRVDMARYNFGRGEYRYYSYPLPPLVAALRGSLYPALADIANSWHHRMGMEVRFPSDHSEFLARCHAAGQQRPTPLILRYGPGDYNCLHQDLYGEHVFPLQIAFLLSAPGADFTGGELVLTEQRPRMQSRASVVPLALGEGVIFAVNQRPVRGTRGDYRVTLRHGVSSLRSGERFTLGVIFHDAT
ncbi:MAG: proline hydroxylase [Gammaproteobacteria bacterium]|nr:proline hydroxylase [Gammaproteobacteria bacterium]